MLTKFGKEVRKLRIDESISLKSMAEGISVSSAFLSSVETGKKPIPKDLVEKISFFLGASPEVKTTLVNAAKESIAVFNLNVSGHADATRETVAMFARNFSSLSDDDLARIKKVMEDANV